MMQTATTRQSGSGRNYVGPSTARLSSALPEDARAIIERETRSVTQSAPARSRGWRLRFDRRAPHGIDPLTGWTTGVDPLAHLSLRFPDLASAIRYTERHDLPYEVREVPQEGCRSGAHQTALRTTKVKQVFNDELNSVWRELFIRSAPEEDIVPAFALPKTSSGSVEAVLETLYRSGGKGGNPRSMLSAGN
jgi:hypothetical protein